MFSDLLLNLIAEIFGIVITVFWIDRLLKRREREQEEKRWRPAKDILYYRLAYSVWSLLVYLKPKEERDTDTKFVYLFGKDAVHSPIDFSKAVNLPARDYVSSIIDSFDDSMNEMIKRKTDSAENILDVYTQLLEPEFLHLLMDYKYLAGEVKGFYERYLKAKNDPNSNKFYPFEFDRSREGLESELTRLVDSTYQLLIWFEKHATEKMTYEQYREKYNDN